MCGRGRLYRVAPGVEIRLDGHALLSAVRYVAGEVPVFGLWPGVHGVRAGRGGGRQIQRPGTGRVGVGRYYLGVPLYRLEGYQAMVGVPVADATQWDQIERVADCAYPVFEQLKTLAAQGEVIYQDDTHVRILSLIAENRQAKPRNTLRSGPGCTPRRWSCSRARRRSACILLGAPMRGESGGAVDPPGGRPGQAAGDVGCASQQYRG